jgi:hypothetical protein
MSASGNNDPFADGSTDGDNGDPFEEGTTGTEAIREGGDETRADATGDSSGAGEDDDPDEDPRSQPAPGEDDREREPATVTRPDGVAATRDPAARERPFDEGTTGTGAIREGGDETRADATGDSSDTASDTGPPREPRVGDPALTGPAVTPRANQSESLSVGTLGAQRLPEDPEPLRRGTGSTGTVALARGGDTRRAGSTARPDADDEEFGEVNFTGGERDQLEQRAEALQRGGERLRDRAVGLLTTPTGSRLAAAAGAAGPVQTGLALATPTDDQTARARALFGTAPILDVSEAPAVAEEAAEALVTQPSRAFVSPFGGPDELDERRAFGADVSRRGGRVTTSLVQGFEEDPIGQGATLGGSLAIGTATGTAGGTIARRAAGEVADSGAAARAIGAGRRLRQRASPDVRRFLGDQRAMVGGGRQTARRTTTEEEAVIDPETATVEDLPPGETIQDVPDRMQQPILENTLAADEADVAPTTDPGDLSPLPGESVREFETRLVRAEARQRLPDDPEAFPTEAIREQELERAIEAVRSERDTMREAFERSQDEATQARMAADAGERPGGLAEDTDVDVDAETTVLDNAAGAEADGDAVTTDAETDTDAELADTETLAPEGRQLEPETTTETTVLPVGSVTREDEQAATLEDATETQTTTATEATALDLRGRLDQASDTDQDLDQQDRQREGFGDLDQLEDLQQGQDLDQRQTLDEAQDLDQRLDQRLQQELEQELEQEQEQEQELELEQELETELEAETETEAPPRLRFPNAAPDPNADPEGFDAGGGDGGREDDALAPSLIAETLAVSAGVAAGSPGQDALGAEPLEVRLAGAGPVQGQTEGAELDFALGLFGREDQ